MLSRCSVELTSVLRRAVFMPFYAVRAGRKPGIYQTWDECNSQVHQFPKARYKKFGTREAALDFVNAGDGSGTAKVSAFLKAGGQTENKCGGKLKNFLEPVPVAKKCSTSHRAYGVTASTHSAHQEPSVDHLQLNINHVTSNQRPGKRKFTSDAQVVNAKKKQRTRPDTTPSFTGCKFDDSEGVIVYTDGACLCNGKCGAKAGIGVYWGPNDSKNISERLPGRPTNNRAEIHAARKAVMQARQNGFKNLLLYTDSAFLINSITKWIKGWKKNGWILTTGQPVVNKQDFEELDLELKDINVKWIHVRGHSGIPGNEAADRLAVAGAKQELR